MSVISKSGSVSFDWSAAYKPDQDRRAKYREAERRKRREFREDVERRREKAFQEVLPKRRKADVSESLEALLTGPWFSSWYEEVTHKDGAKFVDWLLNCDEWQLWGVDRELWALRQVRQIMVRYKWQNPHYRRYWHKNLHNVTDARKRRAIILQLATPKWADLIEVAKFYRLRDQMAIQTGIPHHVDHIIPLQGATVCGLNNEFNLRVITARDNLRKSNRYAT